MPEPTGEVPEAQESALTGMPPGMTQEQLDRIAEAAAPQEPVIDENAQAIARQRILDSQAQVAQASVEAVEAARTANAASTLEKE